MKSWRILRAGTTYHVTEERGGYVVSAAPAWSDCPPAFWSEYTWGNLPAWLSKGADHNAAYRGQA